MPAWPSRALLLLCSILSSPVGQPGHEVTLHRIERSDEEGRTASLQKIPHALRLINEPGYAVTNKLVKPQPVVQLFNKEGRPWRKPSDIAGGWRVSAEAYLAHTPRLLGTTEVDVDGNGEARFLDLAIDGTSSRYVILFRLLSSSTNQPNITTREFVVSHHSFTLHANVTTRDNDNRFELHIRVLDDREMATLDPQNPWKYNITVENVNAYDDGTLIGTTEGSFSSNPVTLKGLEFPQWGYHIQLVIYAWPSNVNWAIYTSSDPFDLLPKFKLINYQPYTFVVAINGTAEEAEQIEPQLLHSFVNTFGVTKKMTVKWDFPKLMDDTTNIKWDVRGEYKKVKKFANSFWILAKRADTFVADGITWALQPQMLFAADGKALLPWFGQDKPPVEGAPYIGGFPLMHLVLIFVVIILALPVIFLLIIWQKRERTLREQYEARLLAELEPEPPKPKRKPRRKDGKDNTAFVSEQSMAANTSTGAQSNPPIFTIEEHSTFQGNTSTFSPTDGLPPARFRWSAPEKSDVVELTMAQLREQHRALIEQGTGFSFSRYRNIIQQQQQLQANQLAQGKPVSAPVVPTGSEKWPTAGSHILVTPAADKVPPKVPTGVIADGKKNQILLSSAMPEPQ